MDLNNNEIADIESAIIKFLLTHDEPVNLNVVLNNIEGGYDEMTHALKCLQKMGIVKQTTRKYKRIDACDEERIYDLKLSFCELQDHARGLFNMF